MNVSLAASVRNWAASVGAILLAALVAFLAPILFGPVSQPVALAALDPLVVPIVVVALLLNLCGMFCQVRLFKAEGGEAEILRNFERSRRLAFTAFDVSAVLGVFLSLWVRCALLSAPFLGASLVLLASSFPSRAAYLASIERVRRPQ